VRKAIDREHSARASARAKTVKLADLLDNCRDIRRGDPGFARVFLFRGAGVAAGASRRRPSPAREACPGDRDRHARPRHLHASDCAGIAGHAPRTRDAQRRAIRVFVDSVVALDLAEPLLWFDVERGAAEVAQHADAAGAAVVGLRKGGAPWGYVSRADLREGRCGDAGVRFVNRQTLSRDARLRDVVHVLTRHDICFVTMLGEVGGVIRREHLNSPIVRMWLFGLITLIEMGVVAEIRTLWPDGAWRAQLSPKRVEKAEALAAERHRQGKPADLLDCLQFADKARVLVADPGQRAALGYKSVAAADQAIRDIESLRNNLAHARISSLTTG
jgi:hypothetical protein